MDAAKERVAPHSAVPLNAKKNGFLFYRSFSQFLLHIEAGQPVIFPAEAVVTGGTGGAQVGGHMAGAIPAVENI